MRVNQHAHERQLKMTEYRLAALRLAEEHGLDDDEFVAVLADLSHSLLQRTLNRKHQLRSPGD